MITDAKTLLSAVAQYTFKAHCASSRGIQPRQNAT